MPSPLGDRGRRLVSEALRLRWVLLLNLYLLSPLVLSGVLLRGSDVSVKLMAFTVLASVFWLVALQSTFRSPFWVHAVLAPFYVVVGSDLFVITLYGTRLTSSMLSVMFENLSDAPEYLHAYLRQVLVTLGVTGGVYVLGMRRIRGLRLRAPSWVAAGAWLTLAALYAAVYRYAGTPRHVAAADRSTPLGVLPQAWLAYNVYRDVLAHAEHTKGFSFKATRAQEPEAPETYVLVIGESCRADHWSLYGYGRETNPHLRAKQNLLTFKDVVSQASFTKASVPFIITRGSATRQEVVSNEKSVVSVFNEVGFHTGWFSSQSRDPFTGAINRFSGEAAEQRFVERQHDEVLLELVRGALGTAGAARPRRFFVVHLMGSHFSTTNRYPPAYNVFPDAAGPGVDEHQALINSYDDSILYTDYVLDALISQLEEVGGVATLLYVSDHGENLRDDARQLFGHFYSNEYDLPVPMLFWYSEAWAQRAPEKLAAARAAAASARLTTQSVFHSLVDQAGIRLEGTEALSVFSAALAPPPRIVLSDERSFDYDEFRASLRAKAP